MAHDFRITDVCGKSAMNNLFGVSDALVGMQANSGILRLYADAGTPDIPAGQPSAGAGHGTVLAELTLNATAFGAAAPSGANVRITGGAVTADSSANASGNAVYGVLYNSAGTTALAQGTVGVGSEFDIQIDNVTIAAGATVSCSAITIDMLKGWTTA